VSHLVVSHVVAIGGIAAMTIGADRGSSRL
jgi:hypothetical protein